MKFLSFYLLLSLISVDQSNIDILYKNSDESTGGFCNISLRLRSSGGVSLVKTEAKYVGIAKDGGVLYKMEADSILGRWKSNKHIIEMNLIADKTLVDSAFLLANYVSKELVVKGTIVVFPESADTLFIHGIPCVKQHR